jgi:hypothetical protein
MKTAHFEPHGCVCWSLLLLDYPQAVSANRGPARKMMWPGLSVDMVEDRLRRLPRSGGVWRTGLAKFLGSELCDHLHLVTEVKHGEVDGVEELRAKMIWHLRRFVSILKPEEARQAAEIAFNITGYNELCDMKNIQDRIQWGNKRGLCPPQRSYSEYIKQAIPDIARELCKQQPIPSRKDIDSILAQFASTSSPKPTFEHDGKDEEIPARPGTMALSRRLLLPLVVFVVVASVTTFALLRITRRTDITPTTLRSNAIPGSSGAGGVSTDLRATLTYLKSEVGLWSLAFSDGHSDLANKYAGLYNGDRQTGGRDPFWDAIAEGGYSLGGISVAVELEGEANKQVTVYDVRPTNLRRDPIATNSVVYKHTGGDTTRQLRFILDQSTPIALLDDRSNPDYGVPFFKVQRIGLVRDAKETLVLRFVAQAASFAFEIAIDYEVNGKKYTQVVKDDNGSIFTARATGALCHIPQELSETEKSRLRQLHYDIVYSEPDVTPQVFTLEPVDPAGFIAKGCPVVGG